MTDILRAPCCNTSGSPNKQVNRKAANGKKLCFTSFQFLAFFFQSSDVHLTRCGFYIMLQYKWNHNVVNFMQCSAAKWRNLFAFWRFGGRRDGGSQTSREVWVMVAHFQAGHKDIWAHKSLHINDKKKYRTWQSETKQWECFFYFFPSFLCQSKAYSDRAKNTFLLEIKHT